MSLAAEDFYRLGASLLNEGNPGEAMHHLRLAEKEIPNDYDVCLSLAKALILLGEQTEGESYLRRCVEIGPDRPEAYHEWAELRTKQKKPDEARKLRTMARQRGDVPKRDEAGPASWTPEASAPKTGDLAFYCPNCEAPIRHGADDLACMNCRQNLLPILHGHIEAHWRMDGEQAFRCAQCEIALTGKELVCPHCETNLLTGALPEEKTEPLKKAPVPGRMKNPVGIAAMVIGFLLLSIGIGQIRTTKPEEARQAWTAVSQRVTSYFREKPEEAAPEEEHRRPDYVAEGHEIPRRFINYAGMILVGGLILSLGLLKYFLDR